MSDFGFNIDNLNDSAIRAWIKVKILLGGRGFGGKSKDYQFQGNKLG
jgi:hypothetical protein